MDFTQSGYHQANEHIRGLTESRAITGATGNFDWRAAIESATRLWKAKISPVSAIAAP
jgi:hypothetical protein